MTFWTESSFEPLRKFAFLVRVGNENLRIDLKTCTLPSWETDSVEHKLMNHMIKYPGIGKWGDCQMTFVVTKGSPQSAFLKNAGYSNITQNGSTMTKGRGSLGTPKIELYDQDGSMVSRWTLHKAWVQTIEFGELSYEEDNFVEVSMTITFDFATIGK
jgi:hypothetical protein